MSLITKYLNIYFDLSKVPLSEHTKVNLLKDARVVLENPCIHAKEKRHEFGLDGGDYFSYIISNILIIQSIDTESRHFLCYDCLLDATGIPFKGKLK